MGLFSKAEYIEVILPFIYDDNPNDVDACIISIEAYGLILDDYKYCYASFEVGIADYDSLLKLLVSGHKKFVKVIVKVKNGTAKDFKIDLDDLAERFNDKRIEKLSLLGWLTFPIRLGICISRSGGIYSSRLTMGNK